MHHFYRWHDFSHGCGKIIVMEDFLKVLLSIVILFAGGWSVAALMIRIFFPFKVTKLGLGSNRYEVKSLKSIRHKGVLSIR